MAIISYQKTGVAPETLEQLRKMQQRTAQTTALLTALGDFWTDYYGHTDVLAQAATAHSANISKAYTKLLDLILDSSILSVRRSNSSQFELSSIRLNELKAVLTTGNVLSIEKGETDVYYVVENMSYVPLVNVLPRINYFFLQDTSIREATYLCSALFESDVILERGKHFDIIPSVGIKFYVDLFNDEEILKYSYVVAESGGDRFTEHILFWACDIAMNSTFIYERYGYFLYRRAYDSEQYRWVVRGLMQYFTSTKTLDNLKKALDIIYGIPYSRYKNETVLELGYADKNCNPISSLSTAATEATYRTVITDKAIYYIYPVATILVKVGDVLERYTMLASMTVAEDYITHPKWWEDYARTSDGSIVFPDSLVGNTVGLTGTDKSGLMDAVLKYNTIYIQTKVTFESYNSWLNQKEEVYKLIKGGVPVYLYPVIESLFATAFIDVITMRDTPNAGDDQEQVDRMLAKLDMSTKYSWSGRIYDGSIKYDGGPIFKHGDDCSSTMPTYNGKLKYIDMINGASVFHSNMYSSCKRFDGTLTYAHSYTNFYEDAREQFAHTETKLLLEDRWEFDRNKVFFYDGTNFHDGINKTYGNTVIPWDNGDLIVNVTHR